MKTGNLKCNIIYFRFSNTSNSAFNISNKAHYHQNNIDKDIQFKVSLATNTSINSIETYWCGGKNFSYS